LAVENIRLHHVGVLVADIAAATSTYVKDFSYEVVSDIILDPMQTALVRFLQLPGDDSYLELVAPSGAESKLSNALKKGGGINHVCYATDDIKATLQRLSDAGAYILSGPTPAVAFRGRSIAWVLRTDKLLTELVERGDAGETEFKPVAR
jgi:methylmalonyl-CoA/ethylmalonyl-CoA epimerase